MLGFVLYPWLLPYFSISLALTFSTEMQIGPTLSKPIMKAQG